MLANDPDALPGDAASWAPGEAPVASKDDGAKITSDLAKVQREKIAATDKVYSGIESTQDRMLPRIEQLSKTVGVEAQSLKPWNADQESADRRTDPIAAFGSFGSVFGIIASAFTNAPMENALNASAAAMNAVKANDDKAYDRAYKAWQDNTKQALDRHKIQHDAYQDAVSLLNVNMSAANTKMQVLAARFGDKQVLTMLEAGMSKEVQDILQSRQKMALELQQQMPKIMLENEKMRDLMEDPRMKQDVGSPDRAKAIQEHAARWAAPSRAAPTATKTLLDRYLTDNPNASADEISNFLRNSKGKADSSVDLEQQKLDAAAERNQELVRHRRAMEEIARGKGDIAKLRADETTRHNQAMEGIGRQKLSPEQEFTTRFFEANPNATTEEYSKALGDFRREGRGLNTDQEIIKTLRAEHTAAGKPEPTSAEIAEAVAKKRGGAAGGNTDLTGARQRAADVATYRKELRSAENEDGTPKYSASQIADMAADKERQLAQRASAPSGNRTDDLLSLRDRSTMMTDTIDKVEGLLAKHKALTGMGGTVTRPMEVVSNWFGSNETDRAQFKRYISELQEWGTRVLNESKGRPLSAEVAKLNNILPGLSAGDTTANTVRAYRELKPLLGTIREQLNKRIEGDRSPIAPGGGAPASGKNAPWLRDPVVPGKRSEIEEVEATA